MDSIFNFMQEIKDIEKHIMTTTLKVTNGSYTEASEILGIKKTTLFEKCRQYKIDVDSLIDPDRKKVIEKFKSQKRYYNTISNRDKKDEQND